MSANFYNDPRQFWSGEADLFAAYLHDEGKLKADTAAKHEDRIRFMAEEYLGQYGITHDELGGETIVDFLGHFYIRKVMWSTKAETGNYLTSFKKWAQFLVQQGKISNDQFSEITEVCKHKDFFLQRYEEYMSAEEDYEYEHWLNTNDLQHFLTRQEQEEADAEAVEASLTVDRKLLMRWMQAGAVIPPVVADFQAFLLTLKEAGAQKLTEARRHLPRKFWKQLDDTLGTGLFHKATLNQEDIPLYQYMYQAALHMGLLVLSKQQGSITEHADTFLALTEAEQLALLMDALWNHIQWRELQQANEGGHPERTQASRHLIAGLLASWPANASEEAYSDFMENKLKNQVLHGSVANVFLSVVSVILVRFDLIAAKFPAPTEIKYAFERTPEQMTVTQAGREVFGYWKKSSASEKAGSASSSSKPAAVQYQSYSSAPARTVHQIMKTPIRAEQTPGRNDPCPCGSGKKYKKCCL